jgi:hypothetical protein
VLYLADMLAAEHQADLLREAEAERLVALVRGARRAPWTLFLAWLAGLIRRSAGLSRAGTRPERPAGARPAGPRSATI